MSYWGPGALLALQRGHLCELRPSRTHWVQKVLNPAGPFAAGLPGLGDSLVWATPWSAPAGRAPPTQGRRALSPSRGCWLVWDCVWDCVWDSACCAGPREGGGEPASLAGVRLQTGSLPPGPHSCAASPLPTRLSTTQGHDSRNWTRRLWAPGHLPETQPPPGLARQHPLHSVLAPPLPHSSRRCPQALGPALPALGPFPLHREGMLRRETRLLSSGKGWGARRKVAGHCGQKAGAGTQGEAHSVMPARGMKGVSATSAHRVPPPTPTPRFWIQGKTRTRQAQSLTL